MILEANSLGLGVDRRMAATAWDFEKINSLYRQYLEVLEGLPSSSKVASPDSLVRSR